MGLQNQFSDVSSESVVIITAVLLAKAVRNLRSLLLQAFRRLFFHRCPNFNYSYDVAESPYDVVAAGRGLAGVVLLCEQLNLNRACSYPNRTGAGPEAVCVVCLNRMGDGEYVRKLACCHVFHKDCFEGWLERLKFDCPLCRAPLVSDERVDRTRRRVAGDLLAWFPAL
ncbi:E3 ubiquitin-protein ligase RHA2A-like [Andrographis paniculata]|uniref:E3 ubiquitin-protein ligase RHA2A-like n=1 Tax=Andrographis paniculata TaxID=175694 RepID=UPI0021E81736|nr:E3 ubiquitin-protein ligase RHA2A-like [Andrographis paniculata]